jgi:hypothetical protein
MNPTEPITMEVSFSRTRPLRQPGEALMRSRPIAPVVVDRNVMLRAKVRLDATRGKARRRELAIRQSGD